MRRSAKIHEDSLPARGKEPATHKYAVTLADSEAPQRLCRHANTEWKVGFADRQQCPQAIANNHIQRMRKYAVHHTRDHCVMVEHRTNRNGLEWHHRAQEIAAISLFESETIRKCHLAP